MAGSNALKVIVVARAVTGSDTSSNTLFGTLQVAASKEGDLTHKVFGWSVGFLVIMALLVYLQSTSVLSWMLL